MTCAAMTPKVYGKAFTCVGERIMSTAYEVQYLRTMVAAMIAHTLECVSGRFPSHAQPLTK